MKILDAYKKKFIVLKEKIVQKSGTKGELMQFQELAYRISVLETLDMLMLTAPATMDMKRISNHYKMFNDFLCHMQLDRLGGMKVSDVDGLAGTIDESSDRQKEIQKKFSSYAVSREDIYPKDIRDAVRRILPVWLRMRDFYINIPKDMKKESAAS